MLLGLLYALFRTDILDAKRVDDQIVADTPCLPSAFSDFWS
jgi:hypothetical protein